MTVSDLISIIAILLAVFAFLSDSDREFIKIKITKFDVLILIIIFLFINFLIYYNYWLKHWSFLKYFYYKNYPDAKTWAYIISVFTFTWILLKIFYTRFPLSKQEELILFYKKLLQNKKFLKLYQLLLKYNSNDILDFFLHKKTRLNNFIINEILSSKAFVLNTENLNLDLYSFIFENIINNNYEFNGTLVNVYLDVQLNSEQSHLQIELSNYSNGNITDSLINKFISLKNQLILNDYFVSLSESKLLKNKLIFNNLLAESFMSDHMYSNNYEKLQLFFLEVVLNSMYNQELLNDYFNNIITITKQNSLDENLFSNSFRLLLNSLIIVSEKCQNKGVTENIIFKIISFSKDIDSFKNLCKNCLLIRNSSYSDLLLNSKHKELIKEINRIYVKNFPDYKGDFKYSVIEVISNY